MSIAIKVLGQAAFGTSTTTAQELLTTYSGNAAPSNANAVPVGKAVIVKNIRVANRDTVKRSVTVNYLPGGGSTLRAVSPALLAIPPGGLAILDEELMLVANDKLQALAGEASGSALLDVVVGGIERDA
jgi:hypothetical protein